MIVRFDTHFIQSQSDLPKAMRITPPGKDVEVQVVRDGKMRTLHLTLATLFALDSQGGMASFDVPLGMEIRKITQALQKTRVF